MDAIDGLEHGHELEVWLDARPRRKLRMRWAPTFGEVARDEFLLYEDSYGRLCIAQNQGDAATALPLAEGGVVKIRRPADSDTTAAADESRTEPVAVVMDAAQASS